MRPKNANYKGSTNHMVEICISEKLHETKVYKGNKNHMVEIFIGEKLHETKVVRNFTNQVFFHIH